MRTELARGLLIGGKPCPASGGARFDVLDPATGTSTTSVALASYTQVKNVCVGFGAHP